VRKRLICLAKRMRPQNVLLLYPNDIKGWL
jgi:hypothetical protein